MNHPSGQDTLPEELEAADALLDQADALLRRHRGGSRSALAPLDDADADELPLLTDVVDALPAPPGPPSQPAATPNDILLAERLVALEAAISKEVESWLAVELPQLLSLELDRLSDRLRTQALAHMRATLLPALSTRIADELGNQPDRT